MSPCLFAMAMDRVTDEIREEAPWTMMFADDIVIGSERRKTEYMRVNERQDNGSDTVKMQGEDSGESSGVSFLAWKPQIV